MLLDQTQRPAPPTRAGWLLILSPIAFVVWVVAVATTIGGTGVETSADLTPQQLATIRTGWLALWPVYALAVVSGAVGTIMVLVALRDRLLRVVGTAAAVLAVLAVTGNLVLNELLAGSTAERLGSDGAYQPALVLSYVAIWAATAAVIVLGLALRRGGVLRRTATVVAILAALYLLADVVTLGFPPFLVGLLWAPIGIGLLRRRRVPSAA